MCPALCEHFNSSQQIVPLYGLSPEKVREFLLTTVKVFLKGVSRNSSSAEVTCKRELCQNKFGRPGFKRVQCASSLQDSDAGVHCEFLKGESTGQG